MLFGGKLIRQPVLTDLQKNTPDAIRVIGDCAGADAIMKHTLFIGTYPGLTNKMLSYMKQNIRSFMERTTNSKTSTTGV